MSPLPHRRVVMSIAAIAMLSACLQPPVSADARPGPQPANPTTAGALFAKGCLQTLPDFSGTPRAIAADPITQRQASGVYYHNTQNLSLRLVTTTTGKTCAVTFGTDQPDAQAIQAFSAAIKANAPNIVADVPIDSASDGNGLTYHTASTDAQ